MLNTRDPSRSRSLLVLPALGSGRIYGAPPRRAGNVHACNLPGNLFFLWC